MPTLHPLLIAALCLPLVQASADERPNAERFFEEQIRPLLATQCLDCHGPDLQESGLRLDSREAILRGADSGETVVLLDQPGDSLLIRAVEYDGDYQMPPDGKLQDAQIQTLRSWVEMGLPWPQSPTEAPVLEVDQRVEQVRREHWSLRAIRRPAIPTVTQSEWPRTATDHFILARLETAGLEPSPPADRYTLIRRATFDLLGLPPTAEQVNSFLDDANPQAYERLIDRLLASPRYGERWGRHWLDVARYADTRGYAFARERRYPYAYTYRDYVISAFNADLPIDRFLFEQLAADQLPPRAGNQALAALGFLTVGRRFNNRHDDIDDLIDVVGRGLLGMTVACARCHDHKFDPIPMADYYSLYGVFASCSEPEELPLLGNPEDVAGYAEFRDELLKLRAEREQFLAEKRDELRDKSRQHVTEYLVRAILETSPDKLENLDFLSLGRDELRPSLVVAWRQYLVKHARADDSLWGPLFDLARIADAEFDQQSPPILQRWRQTDVGSAAGQINALVRAELQEQPVNSRIDLVRRYGDLLADVYQQWKDAGGDDDALGKLPAAAQPLARQLLCEGSPTDIGLESVAGLLNRAEGNRLRQLDKKIESHQVNSPGAPPRAMVLTDNVEPHEPRIFIRGNPARPGEHVPRRSLAMISSGPRAPFTRGSGRSELAETIVDADNPLTRRVFVNRVWMHHFATPLVETPSDFGLRTERSEHAELLDYLAWTLLTEDWSLKALHREILLSSTYRQASRLRESCAAVDPENRLLWCMNRRRLEFEPLRDALLYATGQLNLAMGGRPVELTKAPFSNRRTVYGFIDRQDLPNLLRAFDFASPDQSQSKRPRTTVPQQALFLMNSPFVTQQAQALVRKIESEFTTHDPPQRVELLYRAVYARQATGREIELGCQLVAAIQEDATHDGGLTAWEQYTQMLLMTNEFAFVD